jgi:hypothetical protein
LYAQLCEVLDDISLSQPLLQHAELRFQLLYLHLRLVHLPVQLACSFAAMATSGRRRKSEARMDGRAIGM